MVKQKHSLVYYDYSPEYYARRDAWIAARLKSQGVEPTQVNDGPITDFGTYADAPPEGESLVAQCRETWAWMNALSEWNSTFHYRTLAAERLTNDTPPLV